ncbi:MAG: hypothetical protein L3K08_04245 [Thermoplasmata archaeon]|nr:hypothetical protein [Thermoplasmata archaeon]
MTTERPSDPDDAERRHRDERTEELAKDSKTVRRIADGRLYPWEKGEWNGTGAQLILGVRKDGEPCNDGILLIGKRRSGKTRMATVLVPLCCPDPRDGQCVDPVGVLHQYLPRGWNHVVVSKLNAPAFFDGAYRGPPCFVAMDEMDAISGPRFGATGFCCEEMRTFIHNGRNFGHGYLGIARDCANIPKDTIRNADHLFLARATETNTIEYLRGVLTDTDRLEYAPILRQLPEHVFLYWRPTRTPSFGGFWVVQDGELGEIAWSPTSRPEPTPEPTDSPTPVPTEGVEGADTASDAGTSSPAGAPGAGSAAPSGSGRSPGSAPPGGAPAGPSNGS